jgi:hypothetical protein
MTNTDLVRATLAQLFLVRSMRAHHGLIATALLLSSCEFAYEQHQIAAIHAVGIVGSDVQIDAGYRSIESVLDGLTAVFAQNGFIWPGAAWAHRQGKRYEYAYYLTGERVYELSYVYQAVQHPIVQCSVQIDRKKVSLRFEESEWPLHSHIFPLTEENRQHVGATARIVGDYLRRHLPSHNVEVSIDFGPPHATKT